jgi:hypothetical protein
MKSLQSVDLPIRQSLKEEFRERIPEATLVELKDKVQINNSNQK